MIAAEALWCEWADLIIDPGWWYQRMVEFYAEAFWAAGGGDLIVNTIESVCVACGVPPLDDNISHQLVEAYPSAHDQYRLVVALGARGLWGCGHGKRLLEALRALSVSGDAG